MPGADSAALPRLERDAERVLTVVIRSNAGLTYSTGWSAFARFVIRMTGLPGGVNQVDGEAFVDQESHGVAIAASRRRDRCAGCWSRQGCLRGRPRSGYAAA